MTSLQVIGDTEDSGTKITFSPNAEIFETTEFSFDTIVSRMREMAFLNRGVTIEILDERTQTHKKFHFEGGIVSFVQYLNKNKEMLFPQPIYFNTEKEGSTVEVAMQYNDGYQETIYSYANNINTHEGGTHLIGFKNALTRVVNDYAKKYKFLKDADAKLSGEDIREGLTAIVSVKLIDPQFEGQTKTQARQQRHASAGRLHRGNGID